MSAGFYPGLFLKGTLITDNIYTHFQIFAAYVWASLLWVELQNCSSHKITFLARSLSLFPYFTAYFHMHRLSTVSISHTHNTLTHMISLGKWNGLVFHLCHFLHTQYELFPGFVFRRQQNEKVNIDFHIIIHRIFSLSLARSSSLRLF